MKQQAYHSIQVGLSESLRASLSDQNEGLSDLDDINRDPNSLVIGRQRSSSKEFTLPPLQDDDDHKDQAN